MKRAREGNDESSSSFSSFKEQLEELLLAIGTPGDFACGEHGIELCLPGLVVDGIGMLSVPLSEEAAVRLKAACSRAPFGRGESTLYDPAVRDTWQLAPDRFRLSNPAWDERFLPALVARVKQELGCGDGRVKAELYKLLLYEVGQHFVPHRDTEKVEGMFGTLVVMLPSIYAGGALVVSHGGNQKVYDFAAKNQFSMCFAAFYADCKHEIRPIESGYRLCLVYNLVHTGKGLPPALMDKSVDARRVAELVARWITALAAPKKLILMLEHSYTPDGLSFEGLKNKDRAVAQVLLRAREEIELDVYLAIVEREETGGGDGDSRSGWDIVDPEAVTTLSTWVTPDESEAELPEMKITDEDEIMPTDYWADQEADDESVEEATGNEGATVSRQYHRAALVLIPRVWRVQTAVEHLSRDELALFALKQHESGAVDEARLALQQLLSKSSGSTPIYSYNYQPDINAAAATRLLGVIPQLDASGQSFLRFVSEALPAAAVDDANFQSPFLSGCQKIGWADASVAQMLSRFLARIGARAQLMTLCLIVPSAARDVAQQLLVKLLPILKEKITSSVRHSSYGPPPPDPVPPACQLLQLLPSVLGSEQLAQWLECFAPFATRPELSDTFVCLCHTLSWPAACTKAMLELFSSAPYHRLFHLIHITYPLNSDVAEAMNAAVLKRPRRIGASAELTRLIVDLEKLEPRPALLPTLLNVLVSQNQSHHPPPDLELLESLVRDTRSGRQLAEQVVEHLQDELARNPPIAHVPLAALPPAFASCCQDCSSFARFYREAAATQHVLRAKEAQRWHLRKRITDARLGLHMEDVHTGSPYSLVVTFPAAFVAYRERRMLREELEKWVVSVRRLLHK